jgi:uncharacterized pyridoxal phosphate-containing UPF0001 family protein
LLASEELKQLKNVRITGLMGMATNTDDTTQIRKEFSGLRNFFTLLQTLALSDTNQVSPLEIKISDKQLRATNFELRTLSMGMSGDYKTAIEEGSNMIRVGSAVFGERNQQNTN